MALTLKGAGLAQALAVGFRTIGAALEEIRATTPGAPVRVSLTPAFAAEWLMPQLKGFWSAHSDVPISLHPEKRVIDLRRDNIDVGIRLGTGS